MDTIKTFNVDWTAERLGSIVNSVRESSKSETNAEALYNFVWFMKDYGDKNPELKDGDKYEVNIGDFYHFSSVVGKDELSFEFDAPTFKSFGFTDFEMLVVSQYIIKELNDNEKVCS